MAIARTIRGQKKSRRPGAAALELALILPLLILVALGTIDFGRFAYTYIAVTNAARAGAGFGSSHFFTPTTQPLWEQYIREAAVNEMCPSSSPGSGSFDPDKISIVVTFLSDGQKRVKVEVGYPFSMIVFPTIVNWEQSNLTLSRGVEMSMLVDLPE